MHWMISFLACLICTTLTGSIAYGVWYVNRRWIQKQGYIKQSFSGLRLVISLFLIPVIFPILVYTANRFQMWRGILFSPTPEILAVMWPVFLLWKIGCVLMAVRGFWEIKGLYKRHKGSFACEVWQQELFTDSCRALNVPGKRVKLYQNYRVSVPEFSGILRPKVIIPVGMDDKNSLRVAFIHELTHYRHKDIWFKYMVMLARTVYFFNPLVWWLGRTVNKWCEYACDYEACEYVGGVKKYFTQIFSDAYTHSTENLLDTHLAKNKNDIRERLEVVTSMKKAKKKSVLGACLMTLVLSLAGSATVFAATAGGAKAYEKWFFATEVAIEEPRMEPLPEFTESGDSEGTIVEEGEVHHDARSGAYTFDWSVGSGRRVQSSLFYVEAGEYIIVDATIVPSDKNVKVGITDTSGNRKYVSGNDFIANRFAVSKAGNYRVYVENNNSVSVTASGGYSVR